MTRTTKWLAVIVLVMIGATLSFILIAASSSDVDELTAEEDRNISQLVQIDISPGSTSNPISCKGLRTVIPVAILTTQRSRGESPDFDASTVDPATVTFGPKGATEIHGKGHSEDADGDGDMDLVFHFRADAAGIACGTTDVTLQGRARDGKLFFATDRITTVP